MGERFGMHLSMFPPLGSDDVHCPKCRVVTQLPPGGVAALPTNYALREVAEALEDDVALAPPLGSLGHHHPSRQLSGTQKHNILLTTVLSLHTQSQGIISLNCIPI
jgi:hypothetical protein